jgi:hypothetical protein
MQMFSNLLFTININNKNNFLPEQQPIQKQNQPMKNQPKEPKQKPIQKQNQPKEIKPAGAAKQAKGINLKVTIL